MPKVNIYFALSTECCIYWIVVITILFSDLEWLYEFCDQRVNNFLIGEHHKYKCTFWYLPHSIFAKKEKYAKLNLFIQGIGCCNMCVPPTWTPFTYSIASMGAKVIDEVIVDGFMVYMECDLMQSSSQETSIACVISAATRHVNAVIICMCIEVFCQNALAQNQISRLLSR